MDGTVSSANLVKWQRISIAALLAALLAIGFYSSCQIRYARLDLKATENRASAWRGEAVHVQDLLQKERNIAEDLKVCMTFDRAYIHKLEKKIAKYEATYGKNEPRGAPVPEDHK